MLPWNGGRRKKRAGYFYCDKIYSGNQGVVKKIGDERPNGGGGKRGQGIFIVTRYTVEMGGGGGGGKWRWETEWGARIFFFLLCFRFFLGGSRVNLLLWYCP